MDIKKMTKADSKTVIVLHTSIREVAKENNEKATAEHIDKLIEELRK